MLEATDPLPDTPGCTPPPEKQARGVSGGSAVGDADNSAPGAPEDWVDIEKFPDFQQWSATKKANKRKDQSALTTPESSEDELRGGKKRPKLPMSHRAPSSGMTVASVSSSTDDVPVEVATTPPVADPSASPVAEGALPVGVRRSQRKRAPPRSVQR